MNTIGPYKFAAVFTATLLMCLVIPGIVAVYGFMHHHLVVGAAGLVWAIAGLVFALGTACKFIAP